MVGQGDQAEAENFRRLLEEAKRDLGGMGILLVWSPCRHSWPESLGQRAAGLLESAMAVFCRALGASEGVASEAAASLVVEVVRMLGAAVGLSGGGT